MGKKEDEIYEGWGVGCVGSFIELIFIESKTDKYFEIS